MTATVPSPRRPWLRFLPFLLLLCGLGAFVAVGGIEAISFAALSARYAELEAFVAANRATAMLIYVALYAGLVSLIVFPGAVVLTIASGLLFGTAAGGVLTILGATAGATIVFLATRTAFGDLLRRKAGPRLAALHDGFTRDAFSYLLALRLTPLAPYYVVNIAAGVFGMRLLPYVLGTLVGIAPATFIYAGLGAGAGAAIASGETIDAGALLGRTEVILPLIGLALLSLVPILVRRLRRVPAA